LKDVAFNNFLAEIKKAAAECSAFSFKPTFNIEKLLIGRGLSVIAGIDEAGRGALAGPLCVGLVIYDASIILSSHSMCGIDDSKKLSHRKRVAALDIITRNSAVATSVLVSHRAIDSMNVNRATEFAIEKLLNSISVKPDLVLLDGNFSFEAAYPILSLPKGDTRSVSVASASIVAKVRRDKVLDTLDALYPEYHFSNNKGYGTRRHMQAIYENGFTPLHRKSYNPVKRIISGYDEP